MEWVFEDEAGFERMFGYAPDEIIGQHSNDDVFFMRRAIAGAAASAATQDVSDGQAALACLRGAPPFDDRRQFPSPHLVFLDLKLPFVHGLEVLAAIRHDLACGIFGWSS